MICLNMIVKNEAKVLPRLFASVHKFISHYIIVDTGPSTDGTQAMIKELMEGYGIRGRILFDRWDWNFGRSRQVALDAALKAAQTEPFRWVLFADADEEFEFTDPDWHLKLVPGTSYHLEKHHASLRYALPALVDIRTSQFLWCSPVHNYLKHVGGPIKWETLYSVWLKFNQGEGAKSHGVSQTEKFMRDANILRKELDKDPQDARAAYYLAQSYRDAGEFQLALDAYRYRLKLGGWDEEQYVSLLGVAKCLEHLGRSEGEILQAWLAAYEFRPQRRDALYELMLYYRRAKRQDLAYLFAKHCVTIPKNTDRLFVNQHAYDWQMLDHLAVCAARSGHEIEAVSACRDALLSCPNDQRARIERNLEISLAQLEVKERQAKAATVPTTAQRKVEPSQPLQASAPDQSVKLESAPEATPSTSAPTPLAAAELCSDITRKPLIVIATGNAWSPWSARSLDGPLGGSETAAIRMAEALSADYRVILFCRCDMPGKHGAVLYCDNSQLNAFLASKPPIRLWLTLRYPKYLRYEPFIEETWFWMHDNEPIGDPALIRPETRVLALSQWHRSQLAYPFVSITSNGITPRPLERETVPLRFVYSSSALRGLDNLLEFWPAIKAKHPSAELYVFSSLQTPYIQKHFPDVASKIQKKAQQPGVVWRGPVDQETLALELQEADLWFYPTSFCETYCITAVEMQAYNVLCFYYPVAALCETIGDRGVAVNKDNALQLLDEWLADRPRMEAKKAAARQWALKQTWHKVAEQWKRWLQESDKFAIQLHDQRPNHAIGASDQRGLGQR